MSGGDIRPYREPCDGIILCGVGAIWQHGTNTAQNIPEYLNTTVVTNWTGTGTIPPYERWTQDLSGGDSCEVHFCVLEGAPCAPWPEPIPSNTFASNGSNVDLSVCHKRGFKNVHARRSWHGVFGWTAPEYGCI